MRLTKEFYLQQAPDIAPSLLGKLLCRKFDDGSVIKLPITEIEVYYGADDLASHASKGRTPRTEVMFWEGGFVYVYLIYGMYWLLNIVTGPKNHPQAILIRGLKGINGPGNVGKILKLDKSFYAEDLTKSKRIWLEESPDTQKIKFDKLKRIGVQYAKEWAEKQWRYKVTDK